VVVGVAEDRMRKLLDVYNADKTVCLWWCSSRQQLENGKPQDTDAGAKLCTDALRNVVMSLLALQNPLHCLCRGWQTLQCTRLGARSLATQNSHHVARTLPGRCGGVCQQLLCQDRHLTCIHRQTRCCPVLTRHRVLVFTASQELPR
jgi:hypothetical protein